MTQALTGTVHEDGMKAARAYAGWYLGYPSWADNIINAYLNPQKAMDELERAQERKGA